jgi:cell division protease FtsH
MRRMVRGRGAPAVPAAVAAWPGPTIERDIATPLQRLASGVLRAETETDVTETETETMTADSPETDGINAMADDVDGDSAEPGSEPQLNPLVPGRMLSRVSDPAVLCAMLLLRRAIRATQSVSPPLCDALMVVLEVPAASWTGLVATAWRRMLACDLEPGRIEDRDLSPGAWPILRRPQWILFARDGTDKRDKPDNGNHVAAWAACMGVPVLGVSAAPERLLPEALLRAAERRLTLPPPDLSVLRQVGRILSGRSPRTATRADFADGAGSVSPHLLRLARRPGQTADAWLGRLAELLAVSTAPPRRITLAELAGMDEVVAWGEALARDLADYKAGRLGWSAIDRGALMAGPPGVGKTTAAQAIAGTCNVPLIVTGYAAWQAHGEGHLGDVIQAIRGVFDRARTAAPCLLFIDELDSIQSRNRRGRWDDWWTAIINCLLEQLDGLDGREGVVVIGATNHPTVIDPAILRAGRLDRVIRIPLPDAPALRTILRFHLREDLVDADFVPFAERLARQGATGADVEKLARGGRRRARHAGRPMTADDLAAEIGQSRTVSPELRHRQAVHEAGHAVVASLLSPGSLVRVSIRGSGDIGGWTRLQRDPEAMTRDRVEIVLRTLLAGRAAEEVVLGMPSAGAGGSPDSDLGRASWLAATAVLSCGLGRGRGTLLWRPTPDDRLPDRLPDDVQAEVADMLADAYEAVLTVVRTHRRAVEALADRLIDAGELDGPETEAFLRGLGLAPGGTLVMAHATGPHA